MIVTPERCLSVLRDHDLLPAAPSAVWVAGSLVRGWGNATSDLDVYVAVRQPWEGRATSSQHVSVAPSTVPVEAFYLGDRRWDVEYWLEQQVDGLLEAVSWESFESRRRTAASLTDTEIAFAQRLPFSVVATGEDWVQRRAKEFEASALKTMIAAQALYYYDHLTEDVLGMLDAGDVPSAVLSARLAFGYAVEALLASLGEFNEQAKWRARRVQSVAPVSLAFEEYWEIETMQTFDPAQPRLWVETVLRRCQDIVAEVQL